MMRDYRYIDSYLNELLQDIYPQPVDPEHTWMAEEVMDKWITQITQCHFVLDVGCGEAFLQPNFEKLGMEYTGVCLGKDYLVAKEKRRNVYKEDFHFLPFEGNSFDLIFARHALEHSPMPLLALMEWERIATSWLCLIIPTPKYWAWSGQNHYSVLSASQARYLLMRAGWNPIWEDMEEEKEFRFMCEKFDRKSKLNDSHEEYEFEERNDKDE